MHGGAQESEAQSRYGKRSRDRRLRQGGGAGGTEPRTAHMADLRELRDYFWEKIRTNITGVQLNGSAEKRHPGNLNVSFDYIEGEAILLMLDAGGISVSTGSACSSKSLVPSHVLDALGVPITKMNGTVRFTIGDFTTKEDIDYVADVLTKVVERLRELSPVTGQEGW